MARAGVVRRAQAHSNGAGVVPRVAGRRVGEGRQNHPAAGYSHPLDEATDCDGVPPSTISSSYFSTSCSCSSAVVVPSLPVPPRPSLRATSYLLSAAYFESIEQLSLTWNSGG